MYQAETYRLGTLARSSGRTNWTRGQEHPQRRRPVDRQRELGPLERLAHPGLDEDAQPGRTSSPFQTANSAQPSRTLVTGRAASRGTTK